MLADTDRGANDTRSTWRFFLGQPFIFLGAVMHTALVTSQTLAQTFVTPPGKTILLYGDKSVFPLSLTLAAHAISGENSVAVVDGCNRFDVHLLTRFARERNLDPQVFLQRAFVSRGFTCYQMEQAVVHRLPAFLGKLGSTTAMIFGLLDTFYDEQAPLREVRQILTRILQSFELMKQSGVSLLLVCLELNVLPKERNQLFATLKQSMDSVYRLELREDGKPRLLQEQMRCISPDFARENASHLLGFIEGA